MGQAYCGKLCGENDFQVENSLSNLINYDSDEPNPRFAKKVKQHIELHPKIKSIYLQFRNHSLIQEPPTRPKARDSS